MLAESWKRGTGAQHAAEQFGLAKDFRSALFANARVQDDIARLRQRARILFLADEMARVAALEGRPRARGSPRRADTLPARVRVLSRAPPPAGHLLRAHPFEHGFRGLRPVRCSMPSGRGDACGHGHPSSSCSGLCLRPAPAEAQAEAAQHERTTCTETLRGVINDEASSEPVAGARISAGEHGTQSDDAGTFVLTALCPGERDIDIAHPDYEPTTRSISLPRSQGRPPARHRPRAHPRRALG